VSDDKREKDINKLEQEAPQNIEPKEQDVEALLNEIRQQQNFTPKAPQAQAMEEAPAPEQKPSEEQPKREQAEAVETQRPAFGQFEDISSSSGEQKQENVFVPALKPAEKKPEQKKKSRGKYVVMGVLGLVILLAASFFCTLFLNPEVIPSIAPVTEVKGASPEPKEAVFAKGVQVGGIDVSGKTLKQATALIIVKEKDAAPEFSLDVVNGDMTLTYTQDDFSYTYNTKEVIAQAYQYSKDVAKALSDGSIDRLSNPQGDNVTVDDKNGTINFNISCTVTNDSIEKVVGRAAKKMDVPAVEPHVSKFNPSASYAKMFTFTEGEDGVSVDREKLYNDISAQFSGGVKSGSVTVQTEAAKPKHTLDEVKKATKLIGKFSTVSTNTYNANHNMDTALKAINGKIVEPGKNFSFNECTGDSNLASNGYLPASVIENGSYQQGYGGGICQAATTIYNAGIQANMGITERYPHLWCSSYVYGGLDATIDYGNLDLKLQNNTQFQMFFKTYMDGTTLYCEIYGWQDPDFDEVRTESHNTWTGDEEYGFAAQRVYYKGGKEVGRDNLPDSTYSLSNGHYVVAGDPGNTSRKLKQPGAAKEKSDEKQSASSTKPVSTSSTQQQVDPPASQAPSSSKPETPSSRPDSSSQKPDEPSQAPSSKPESGTSGGSAADDE